MPFWKPFCWEENVSLEWHAWQRVHISAKEARLSWLRTERKRKKKHCVVTKLFVMSHSYFAIYEMVHCIAKASSKTLFWKVPSKVKTICGQRFKKTKQCWRYFSAHLKLRWTGRVSMYPFSKKSQWEHRHWILGGKEKKGHLQIRQQAAVTWVTRLTSWKNPNISRTKWLWLSNITKHKAFFVQLKLSFLHVRFTGESCMLCFTLCYAIPQKL